MEPDLELILKLQVPQDVKPKAGRKSPGRLFKAKITDRDKADFCTQLSVMLQARVSLHRALEVLIGQTTREPMKEVIAQIASEVQKGSSFDKALATPVDHPANFLGKERVHFLEDIVPKFYEVIIPVLRKAFEFVYVDGPALTPLELPPIDLDTGRLLAAQNNLNEPAALWT
jgi:hypothetical protein